MDSYKNFAVSKVATAPSPATTGTSLVVESGNGTYFSEGANAVVCPDGEQPTWSNAEIVRITAITTDTFTITREQESTSARTIAVGDVIYQGITDKWLDDLLNGQFIVDASGKSTPVDADTVPLIDSADSSNLKKLTWANLKATIKSYYDSVTATLTNKTIDGDDNTIQNLTVAMLKSGVLDTNLSSTSGSDDTLPSAKAVKSLFDGISDVTSSTKAADGHIRFECGIQIAWKDYTVTLGGNMWNTDTDVWYSDHSMGNWTASFSTLWVSFPSVNASQFWATQTGQSSSSAGTVRVFRPNSSTISGKVMIVGIGSWS